MDVDPGDIEETATRNAPESGQLPKSKERISNRLARQL